MGFENGLPADCRAIYRQINVRQLIVASWMIVVITSRELLLAIFQSLSAS